MFRLPVKYRLIPCTSFVSVLFGDPDTVSKDTKTEQLTDTSAAKPETGIDRLRKMFTLDEFDEVSPEIVTILNVAYMSAFVGVVYGGFMSSRTAYMDFMQNNQASLFKTHFEAKRKLQDAVTISFGKGAIRWCWRLTLFSTSYMGLSTCIATYRGKNGILEHVLAGGLSGALYKFTLGPRGWIVGGGLGLALGTIAGTLTYGILKLGGISMEDVRYWQYKWRQDREKRIAQGLDKNLKPMILLSHEEKLGEAGKSLDNLNVTEN